MAAAKKGRIKEFDGELMIMVMDYIKVFESGKLKNGMQGRLQKNQMY